MLRRPWNPSHEDATCRGCSSRPERSVGQQPDREGAKGAKAEGRESKNKSGFRKTLLQSRLRLVLCTKGHFFH